MVFRSFSSILVWECHTWILTTVIISFDIIQWQDMSRASVATTDDVLVYVGSD